MGGGRGSLWRDAHNFRECIGTSHHHIQYTPHPCLKLKSFRPCTSLFVLSYFHSTFSSRIVARRCMVSRAAVNPPPFVASISHNDVSRRASPSPSIFLQRVSHIFSVCSLQLLSARVSWNEPHTWTARPVQTRWVEIIEHAGRMGCD